MGSQILNILVHEIHTIIGKGTVDIVPESVLMDIPNWDSITHMQVITRTEEVFNIRFSIEELMAIATVDALVKAIKSKTSSSASDR
ncbi:MAG: hypothetical protein HW380_3741 [Magnetococcales bacterium]|nr:hypothetical protein [Magnetococcales bacterium]HIJ85950.1 acyl carrier protein [Magnetococcales bacterium]